MIFPPCDAYSTYSTEILPNRFKADQTVAGSAEGGVGALDSGPKAKSRRDGSPSTPINAPSGVTSRPRFKGSEAAENLYGHGDADYIDDICGDDVYRFGRGGGVDSFVESTGNVDNDRLIFDAGIMTINQNNYPQVDNAVTASWG